MVVLSLPGWMPDAVACGLALQLAQTMALLAGPSALWVEQEVGEGGKGGAVITRLRGDLKGLFDRLCDGTLRQLSGPGWSKVLPAVAVEAGVLALRIEEAQQKKLEAILRSHEVGGLAGAPPQAPQLAAPIGFNFYSRTCCLFYRGLTVCSGLPPEQTRLAWQLCWALGAHGQATALPCQVTMHRVCPSGPGRDACAVDAAPAAAQGGGADGAASGAWDGRPPHRWGDEGEATRPRSSLMILVSACHMVLAVVLTSYDEEIEELPGDRRANKQPSRTC